MTLKIGNIEVPTTATATFNGQSVNAIVFNGVTVWQKGSGLSRELELAKTPILMHCDSAQWLNEGSATTTTYNFGTSAMTYQARAGFGAYVTRSFSNGSNYMDLGGLTLGSSDKYSVEAICMLGMNGYAGDYAELVFSNSGGDLTPSATVTATWRMRLTYNSATSATLTIGNDSTTVYTGTTGAITTTDKWYHLAATYNGNGTWTFFANGTLIGTYSFSGVSTGFNFVFINGGTSYDMGGWDEIVVHNYARYTSSFTPQTQPYTIA